MNEISHADAAPTWLSSWMNEPRRIGGRLFSPFSEHVRVIEQTYQHKSHTSGYISGVTGFSYDGYGITGGGGGVIGTTHESVVSCVLQKSDGSEFQMDFPAGLAVRKDSIVRLDIINQTLVAARNISGRGTPILFHNEDDYFPRKPLSRFRIFLGIIGIALLGTSGLTSAVAGAVLCIPAVRWFLQEQPKKRHRAEMRELIIKMINSEAPTS